MKILSIHIENFGKLHDADFSFKDGLNTICLPNGTGKSTLATFIKVMFYGFDNEGKRDELENERKHYFPWQGGAYGGSIAFEASGKSYELQRSFGQKDKDDTFLLRDLETKLESKDFTSNIGEELFGINSESFVRSAFISQSSCETEATDSINTKMGNLVDNTDDLNRYGTVIAALDEAKNHLSATRKTGELSKIKSEINDLKVKIKEGQGIDEAVAAIFDKSEADKKAYAALKEEQAKLNEKQKEMSVYKDAKATKLRYEEFVRQEKERKENLDKTMAAFKGSVPAKEELEEAINLANSVDKMHEKLDALKDYQDSDSVGRGKELTEKIEKYELKFATGVPTDSEISRLIEQWSQRSEQKGSLSQKKDTLQTLMDIDDDKKEKAQEKLKKSADNLRFFGGILLILSVIGLFYSKLASPKGNQVIIIFGAIFVCIALTIVLFVKANITRKTAKNMVFPVNPHLVALRSEIESSEVFVKDVYNDTEDFFIRYNLPLDEYTVVNELYNLKKDIEEYEKIKVSGKEELEKYKEKEEEYKKLKADYEDGLKKLEISMKKFGYEDIEPSKTITELNSLRDLLREYQAAKAEHDKAAENLKMFEDKTPDLEEIKNLKEPEGPESMQVNEARLASIHSQLENLSRNIEAYKRELDDFRLKKEETASYENALEIKEEEQQLIAEKLDIVNKTKEFMTAAKVNLTKKYTGPITDGFNKYYKLLDKEASDDKFAFDAHINLEFAEQGSPRKPGFLSRGLRDMSGIALRMAFVDAMYQDEKPFVVFDDPYVNLDDEKLKAGLGLLEDLSKEHQIIYFTCNQLRAK